MIGQEQTSISISGARDVNKCADDLSTPCDTPYRYLAIDQVLKLVSHSFEPNTCGDIQNGHFPAPIWHNGQQFWCEEEVQEFLKSRRDQN